MTGDGLLASASGAGLATPEIQTSNPDPRLDPGLPLPALESRENNGPSFASAAMQATDPIRAISYLLASASLGGRAIERVPLERATPPNLLASCTRHVRLRVRRGSEGGMLGGDADGGMD